MAFRTGPHTTHQHDVSSLPPAVKYAIVGVFNTLFDFAIFVALTEATGISPMVANIVSYGTAILVSFLLNRRFVFHQTAYHYGAPQQFARFVIVNLLSLALSTTLVVMLATRMPPAAAKLLSIPPVFIWGFLCTKRVVFVPPSQQ